MAPSLLKRNVFPFFTDQFSKSTMIREHILTRKARGKHFKKRDKKVSPSRIDCKCEDFWQFQDNLFALSLIGNVSGQSEIQLDRNLPQWVIKVPSFLPSGIKQCRKQLSKNQRITALYQECINYTVILEK